MTWLNGSITDSPSQSVTRMPTSSNVSCISFRPVVSMSVHSSKSFNFPSYSFSMGMGFPSESYIRATLSSMTMFTPVMMPESGSYGIATQSM